MKRHGKNGTSKKKKQKNNQLLPKVNFQHWEMKIARAINQDKHNCLEKLQEETNKYVKVI